MLKINDLRAFWRPFLGARFGKFCSWGLFLAVFAVLAAGCGDRERDLPESVACSQLHPLKYSKALRLDSLYGERVAEIRSVVGRDTLVKRFVFRRPELATGEGLKTQPLHRCLDGALVLPAPVGRIVALSSAQVGYLLRLDAGARIVAVGEGKYIVDSSLFYRVEGNWATGQPRLNSASSRLAGTVAEVGNGTSLNLEKLVALGPDLVMTFATGGSQDDYQRLAALGLPLMLTSEWQEDSPLAKMEWIKLYAMMLDDGDNRMMARADSVFGEEAVKYVRVAIREKLQESSRSAFASGQNAAGSRNVAGSCPRVLAGMSYGGVWYAPGGNSYTARLIRDAGGCYLWAADTSRELRLTLEEVFALGDSVDVWINPGMFASAGDILATEPRVAQFKAFREKRVYQNDGRKGPGGGNDFYEGAVARSGELLQNLQDCIHEGSEKAASASVGPKWYHNIF